MLAGVGEHLDHGAQARAAEGAAQHAGRLGGDPGAQAGSAQHALDPGHQLARAEGLGDVVVGPQLERAQHVVLALTRGEHQDRHRARERPEPRQQREAVHVAGELDVEHAHAHAAAAEGAERRGGIRVAQHLEALLLELPREQRGGVGLVLHEEQAAPALSQRDAPALRARAQVRVHPLGRLAGALQGAHQLHAAGGEVRLVRLLHGATGPRDLGKPVRAARASQAVRRVAELRARRGVAQLQALQQLDHVASARRQARTVGLAQQGQALIGDPNAHTHLLLPAVEQRPRRTTHALAQAHGSASSPPALAKGGARHPPGGSRRPQVRSKESGRCDERRPASRVLGAPVNPTQERS